MRTYALRKARDEIEEAERWAYTARLTLNALIGPEQRGRCMNLKDIVQQLEGIASDAATINQKLEDIAQTPGVSDDVKAIVTSAQDIAQRVEKIVHDIV